jgi:hypothetical protein
MDHLGIDKFMVMGFCIGGPFICEPLCDVCSNGSKIARCSGLPVNEDLTVMLIMATDLVAEVNRTVTEKGVSSGGGAECRL